MVSSIFQGTLINIAVWTNIAIVFVWTAGFSLSNIFQCWPISLNWATPGMQTWGSCIDLSMMNLALAYSDVFTDCECCKCIEYDLLLIIEKY